MSVVLWVVVGLFVVGAFTTVMTIGKPRKPVTPGTAAFIVGMQGLLIVAILIDRGVIRS